MADSHTEVADSHTEVADSLLEAESVVVDFMEADSMEVVSMEVVSMEVVSMEVDSMEAAVTNFEFQMKNHNGARMRPIFFRSHPVR